MQYLHTKPTNNTIPIKYPYFESGLTLRFPPLEGDGGLAAEDPGFKTVEVAVFVDSAAYDNMAETGGREEV